MRHLSHLEPFRVPIMGDMGNKREGAYMLKIKGETYSVIFSSGGGWEHVSIAHKHKIPSWKTMCELKDLFFEPEEVVMQLHPKKSEYVNNHENCLHLWRPIQSTIPTPPRNMVGI